MRSRVSLRHPGCPAWGRYFCSRTFAFVFAGPISVQTQTVGNYTNLVSATSNDGFTEGPGTGLIGIQIFNWNVTTATTGPSVTVVSPDPAGAFCRWPRQTY